MKVNDSKFLTALEIREKYKNDVVISWAFAEQMRLIELAAAKGETQTPLIRSVSYYIEDDGSTHIGYKEGYPTKSADVDDVVLVHFLRLGFKKTKIGKCPYLTWAVMVV